MPFKNLTAEVVTRPTTESAPVEVEPEVSKVLTSKWEEVEKGGSDLVSVRGFENSTEVEDFMTQARQWGKDHTPALTVRAYAPRKEGKSLPENEAWFTLKKTDPTKKIGRPATTSKRAN